MVKETIHHSNIPQLPAPASALGGRCRQAFQFFSSPTIHQFINSTIQFFHHSILPIKIFYCFFPLKKTLRGFRDSIFSKIIVSVAKIGTAKIIPATPQMYPQKIRDRITIRGLRFKVRPIKRGSNILPMDNCNMIMLTIIQKATGIEPNCKRLNKTGSSDAIIEPMVGI